MKAFRVFAGIGGLAVLSVVGVAHAADLSAPVAVAPPAPLYSWNGFYAGVNGGFGGGTFSYPTTYTDFDDSSNDTTADLKAQASGFFGGGQVGFNWQANQTWLFGLEADAAFSGINDKISATIDGDSGDGYTSVDWFSTVRGRIGAVYDRLLVYGTGGFAFGGVKSGYDLSSVGLGTDSKSTTAGGWTLGAGFEYKLTHNISLKTEYLYVDLGKQSLYNDELFGDDNLNIKSDVAFHTIKAGINLSF